MTPAIAHRIPRPLSVLTALAALVLSAPLALIGAPGHAVPMDDDAPGSGLKITSDVVIKSNDTYYAKLVLTDNSGFGIFNEDNCKAEDVSQPQLGKSNKNAKATFKKKGDSSICTIEGTASIKDSEDSIKHQGNEYVVKIGSDEAIGDTSQLDVTQTITFPGKVTDADGGKVEGNKVTFTDIKSHTVKGGDGSIPMWVWIIITVGVLAVIGGAVAFFVARSKKNKTQMPYGTPVQGYDPSQAFPAQPGQPGYGTPQGQPGYGAGGQQPGYGVPQAQPGQQTGYGTPGQGTY